MMPNDVISFHTVQCLWQIGVTWDSNKVLLFLHFRTDHSYYSNLLKQQQPFVLKNNPTKLCEDDLFIPLGTILSPNAQ